MNKISKKLIKCPKCKSVFLSVTVDTTAVLYYTQDPNGLHPNGGEQEDATRHLAICKCEDCGTLFKVRQDRLNRIELNEDYYTE